MIDRNNQDEKIHQLQLAHTTLQHVCHLLHNLPVNEALVENAIRPDKETTFSIYFHKIIALLILHLLLCLISIILRLR